MNNWVIDPINYRPTIRYYYRGVRLMLIHYKPELWNLIHTAAAGSTTRATAAPPTATTASGRRTAAPTSASAYI